MNKSVREYCREAAVVLDAAGVENAAAEARWLAEYFFNCDAAGLLSGALPHSGREAEGFCAAVRRRCAGEPLQYILGSADFMGIEIAVGRGVLVPRPETEVTVRAAAQRAVSGCVCYDLCAGSGCASLGLCSLVPDVEVYAVEKYAAALSWLEKNTEHQPSIHIYKADILKNRLTRLPRPYIIMCNPPYIPSCDISGLATDVKREPHTALDGGGDGLVFYRVLADLAVKRLVVGGSVCVEVGIGQAESVGKIFAAAGLIGIETIRDFAGIERTVCAAVEA